MAAPLPFAGSPYGYAQNQAQLAYQNALASIGTQRNQYMQQEGFDPSTGKVMNNPLSQWGQLSGSLEHAADSTDQMIRGRGLGTMGHMKGVGMQLEELGNQARDQQLYNFSNAYRGGMENFDQQKLNAQNSFTDATNQNTQKLIEWLIKTGQFNTWKNPKGGK